MLIVHHARVPCPLHCISPATRCHPATRLFNRIVAIQKTSMQTHPSCSIQAAMPIARAVRVAPAKRIRLRVSRIAILVALMVAGHPLLAQTAHSRLGTPEVLSSLGSPLRVKIPIEATAPGEDVSTSRFMLGARPLNASMPFLESAEVGFERVGDNTFLVIRSRQSIDEPAIGLVIREQIPNGVRSREFMLLLDPPPLAAPARAETRPAVAGEATSAAPRPIDSFSLPRASVIAAAVPQPPATSAPPVTAGATIARTAARQARAAASPAPAALPANPSADAPRRRRADSRTRPAPGVDNGPRLTLSLGEGLNERANATEAERADLRLRRALLDMDDLTAALLERQNRISHLERELGELTVRMATAERAIAGGTIATGQPAPAISPTIGQPGTAATTAPVATATRPALSGWTLLLSGFAALAALMGAAWLTRRMMHLRDENYRLVPQAADDYFAEVLASSPTRRPPPPEVVVVAMAPVAAVAPQPAVIDGPAAPATWTPPEIQFELPETPPSMDELPPGPDAGGIDFSLPASADSSLATEDLRSRRMRYLQSRYQDIAILMPPLDAPQRLLRQAGTVYAEGAADFAKRLLKFAAYSRPYVEEYWLALLELLFRENFASDYVVNAKWFHHHLAGSAQWSEVVRIGYLLDPAEPLFADATHWSHEDPVAGTWLPSEPGDPKAVSPLPHLELQLAS